MDFQINSEQELIRATAREFAEREIAPHARDWDRSEEIDRSLVPKLADAGYLGAGWDEEYGGSGLDVVSYALVVEELGKADSSVRGIVSVNVGLVGKTIARFGNEEQKREWLPRLASGDALGCYALTEPGCGSDAAALVTRASATATAGCSPARRRSSRSARGPRSRSSSRARAARGPKGITCFLVPTDADGFEARPIKGKLGLRAQDTSELSLDGVRVPDENRLGELGGGFRVAMSALDDGRISLAAGCVGIAQGCLDASVGYSRERRAFGRPIAGFQLVQELIAEIAVETEAARLLTWRAAALADAHVPHTLESSVAKLYASEAAVRAANNAVQVFGGYGYVDEYPGREVPPRRARHDPLRGHEPDPEADHRPRADRRARSPKYTTPVASLRSRAPSGRQPMQARSASPERKAKRARDKRGPGCPGPRSRTNDARPRCCCGPRSDR